MIVIKCDLCLKEIKEMPQQPQGWCLCAVHVEFGEEFYKDQQNAIHKAVESNRSRFMQKIANRPKKLELAK